MRMTFFPTPVLWLVRVPEEKNGELFCKSGIFA